MKSSAHPLFTYIYPGTGIFGKKIKKGLKTGGKLRGLRVRIRLRLSEK